MKPVLVLALGNAFAGDDGVGCAIAAELERIPGVAELADVHCAGTDVLRAGSMIRGRRRLVMVDAVLQDAGAPTVQVCAHRELHGQAVGMAHALDPVAALELLRALEPEVAAAETFWVLVGVASIRLGAGLSTATRALLPDAVEQTAALVLGAGRVAARS